MGGIGGLSSSTLGEILGVKSFTLSLMASPSTFPQYDTLMLIKNEKFVEILRSYKEEMKQVYDI